MPSLQEIDYTPLRNMRRSYFKVASKFFMSGLGIVLGIASLILVLVGLLLKIPVLLGAGIAFGITICGSITTFMAKSYRDSLWRQFGEANGWTVESDGIREELLPPSLLYGIHKSLGLVLQGYVDEIVFQIYKYSLQTGFKKYMVNRTFTVTLLRLPVELPHIQLISKSVSGLRKDLESSRRLQLEGNFNDYFELYVENNQQIEVLSVLTPEVMEAITNFDTHTNIEIIDSRLFFVISADRRDQDKIKELVNAVIHTSQLIIRNIELGNYHVSIEGR